MHRAWQWFSLFKGKYLVQSRCLSQPKNNLSMSMTPANSILLDQEPLCSNANQEHFGLQHAVFFQDLSKERNHHWRMSFRYCIKNHLHNIYLYLSTFLIFLGDESAQENGTADSLSFHPDFSLLGVKSSAQQKQRSPASSARTGRWHQSLPSQLR